MQVADALSGKDSLVNFWGMYHGCTETMLLLTLYLGFSYGTTIGSVLAAMFPERMGYVALDGVDNPREALYG